MAVGFGTVTFAVLASDGTLPAPAMDERGWLRYDATILLAAGLLVDDLRDLASTITIKPALGMRNGGLVVVEAGVGTRTLTIPTPAGGEQGYTAILTGVQPVANLLRDDAWQVDASWLLIAEVA